MTVGTLRVPPGGFQAVYRVFLKVYVVIWAVGEVVSLL